MELLQSLPSQLVRNLLGNLDLAVLFGSYLLMAHGVKLKASSEGLDTDKVADLSFWIAVGALIGGRLGHALPSPQTFLSHPVDLLQIHAGLSFQGALGGALAAGGLLARRGGLPFWRIADIYGLYAPLAIAATRLSCLLSNTCYGVQASPPLGIVFPGLTQPRYPSELYEGLFALLIFVGILWLKQRDQRQGTLFLAFLVAYPLLRAAVDLTRVGLGSQWGALDAVLSVAVALAAAAVLWFRLRRGNSRGIESGRVKGKYREVPDVAK